MSQTMLSCKSCDRGIEGAALACAACGALHHEGCHRGNSHHGSGHCAVCASAKPAVAVSVGGRDRARSAALLAAALVMCGLFSAIVTLGHHCPVPRKDPGPAPILIPQVRTALALPAHARPTNVAGRFRGTISGNDPRVTADLVLHQEGYELDGVLFWSSPNSGKNERRVRGHLDPDRGMVMLHDVEMPVAQANGGWRFCPVDYYLLEADGDALTGNYWSQECNDRARMNLTRTH